MYTAIPKVVKGMQNPRMLPPEKVLNPKARKKKQTFQAAPAYQRQAEYLKGVSGTPLSSMMPTQKALKRPLKNDIRSLIQHPDRAASDSLPDSSRLAEEYKALRRRYFLLEKENGGVERELREVEDEVNVLEEEKLAFLDQIVVLEGLIDPSEIETRRPAM